MKYSFGALSKHRNEIYGSSIFWIMLFHSYILGYTWEGILSIFNIGNMGCEVFIFMSGICLYYSMKTHKTYRSYLCRRLERVYLPVIVICSGFWIFNLCNRSISWQEFLLNFSALKFWITGDQQIWFVSFILIAYLLYPVLYAFVFRKQARIAILMRMLLLTLAAYATVLIPYLCFEEWYDLVEIGLTRLPVFVIGIGFGKLVYDNKEYSVWFLLLQFLLLCGTLLFLKFVQINKIQSRLIYILGGIPITIILSVVFDIPFMKSIGKIFSFFGKMSLELYLVNIILIRLYQNFFSNSCMNGSLMVYLAVLALNVVLAYIFSMILMHVRSFIAKKELKWIK